MTNKTHEVFIKTHVMGVIGLNMPEDSDTPEENDEWHKIDSSPSPVFLSLDLKVLIPADEAKKIDFKKVRAMQTLTIALPAIPKEVDNDR